MTFPTMDCDMNPQPIVSVFRAVLRLVLIVLAFFVMGGPVGIVVGIIGMVGGLVGLVLIAAGTFNLCVVAPFVGCYFDGHKNLEGRSPTTSRGHRGAPQH